MASTVYTCTHFEYRPRLGQVLELEVVEVVRRHRRGHQPHLRNIQVVGAQAQVEAAKIVSGSS